MTAAASGAVMDGFDLSDIRVLDLSEGVSGAYCTKLLADHGAEVIKVEKPGTGDPGRHLGPFQGNQPHPEKSCLFHYLNTNKKSVALDVSRKDDIEKVKALAGTADVLVENSPPGAMERLGLGYQALSALNPRLVVASVTHFGQTGPYRDYQATEIVDSALGGYMFFGGDASRPPLMMPGSQCQYNAGLQAAIAIMAALYCQRATGRGQHVDVSAVESMLSNHVWTSVMWSHEGRLMRRIGNGDIIPCKDGFIHFMPAPSKEEVFKLIGKPELARDPRFSQEAMMKNLVKSLALIYAEAKPWSAQHTKEEIYREAQGRRLAFSPVNTMKDLLGDRQLRAREWFAKGSHPAVGELTYPGPPFKTTRATWGIRSAAPLLGQHTKEVLAALEDLRSKSHPASSLKAAPSSAAASGARRGPLAGVRILEVTAHWAGPLAGRFLADLGAESIKVEGPTRMASRAGHYPGGDSQRARAFNRSGYFNKLNRNKYDISLDLASPKGKALFKELVKISDVVMENNSARVMKGLELDYPVLEKVNPRIIMLSITGLGMTGPDRDYSLYGSNVEALSGLCSLMGYGEGDLYRTGSLYGDPIAGCHGALAVLIALHQREKTGLGQYIDLSLVESTACLLGEFFLDCVMNGRILVPTGNRDRHMAPQGCYRCQGTDVWAVLSVRTDDEWRTLCDVIGAGDLAKREELSTLQGRQAHHDEVDRAIEAWTSQRDSYEVMRLLQKAGIPAAPVLNGRELLADPHLYHRGFYVTIEHPEIGVYPFPGMPWKLSETPAQVRMPAPLYAEHNDFVLHKLLGLSRQETARLKEERVVSDMPLAGAGHE